MKISKITIQNFKGITKLVLDLDREPVSKIFTMVGLNESGKTSILEALDILENDKPKSSWHELIPKGKKMDFNGSIEISAEYIWNDEDRVSMQTYIEQIGYHLIQPIAKHSVTKRYSFNDSEPVDKMHHIWSLSFSVTKNLPNPEFNNLKGEEWSNAINHVRTYLMPKIIYYPNFLFNFPERIFLNSEAIKTDEEKKYLTVIQDILSYIKPDLTIERHLLERMRKSEKSSLEALESTLGKMSYTVTNVVFNAWDRIFNKGTKEIIISYGSTEVLPQESTVLDPLNGKQLKKIVHNS